MVVGAKGTVPLLENTPERCDVCGQALRSGWHTTANKVNLISVRSEQRGIKEETIMKML